MEDRKETKETFSGNGVSSNDNDDAHFEAYKNLQSVQSAKSDSLISERDWQASAHRKKFQGTEEQQYSGISETKIDGDLSYRDKSDMSDDIRRNIEKGKSMESKNIPMVPNTSPEILLKEDHFGNTQPMYQRHFSSGREKSSYVNERYREKGYESIWERAERLVDEGKRRPIHEDYQSAPPPYNEVIGKTFFFFR